MQLDNPVLSELDSLSPHAKSALAQAHGKILQLNTGGSAPLAPAPPAETMGAPKLPTIGAPQQQPPTPGMLPSLQYAKPGPYTTTLPPDQEQGFQSWVKQNKIPFDPSPTSDYDMRGYYQANQGQMNGTQVSGFDGKLHYPDTYKTPYHKTFSNESEYATPDAPHWQENRLIDKSGNVVTDETPKAQPIGQPSEQPPSAPTGMLPTIGGQQQPQQSHGMLPTLAQPSPTVAGDRAELSRLNTTGSGVSQIHNPFLKTLGVIGDAVGTGLFPRIAAQVPGTTAHHQQLVGAAGQQLKADEGVETETAKNELTGAQAAEQASLPQYHQSQAELGATKAALTQEKQNEAGQHHKSQNSAQLAQHGFKEDENGKIVPLGYEEMSEPQQAVHDLSASRQELYEATSALKKAQKDNQPAMMRMAQQRIDNANRNAGIAAQRLGLSEKQFEMRAHGTENGEALPGAILGDDNKPVGTAFQQNIRPTGQERNKADLASSAREQLSDITDIMTKRKDIFGPVNGRKTDFSVWLGSQDPDAQKFRAARTIAADHLAGVFGGRSEAALSALDNAVGQFKDNPEAAIAGVKQLDKANTRFIEKGTPKTAGSNAAKDAGATSGTIKARDPQGKLHEAPAGTTLPQGWKLEK